MSKAKDDDDKTPRPVKVPSVTTATCQTPRLGGVLCGVNLLSDGVCPRCNPRVIAPGPKGDGTAA